MVCFLAQLRCLSTLLTTTYTTSTTIGYRHNTTLCVVYKGAKRQNVVLVVYVVVNSRFGVAKTYNDA